MAGCSQFQGQFGINDTSLTRALQEQDFQLAEKLISALSAEDLDDGLYEYVPLRMVLCNSYLSTGGRNLKLANLLVRKGANTNIRIPLSDFDGVYSSPFEELIVYYVLLVDYIKDNSSELCEYLDILKSNETKLQFLTNTIRINGEVSETTVEACHILVTETSELIDTFLEYGADPNTITIFSRKSIFHWVVEYDLSLAERLLQTGRVNVNLADYHGNTPLMNGILKNDPKEALCLYNSLRDSSTLLDIKVENCCGESALFLAVFAGATEVAIELRKTIACPSTNIDPLYLCIPNYKRCFEDERYFPPILTPMFSPLLADSPVRTKYETVGIKQLSVLNQSKPIKSLIDKVIISSISPLVDNDFFLGDISEKEIRTQLKDTFLNHLIDKDSIVQPKALINLMFGQVKAGLAQLCVRTIFDEMLTARSSEEIIYNKGTVVCSGIQMLFPEDIQKYLASLGLPHAFQVYFEIECAKYQICEYFINLQLPECTQECSESYESEWDQGGLSNDTFLSTSSPSISSDSRSSSSLSISSNFHFFSDSSSDISAIEDSDDSFSKCIPKVRRNELDITPRISNRRGEDSCSSSTSNSDYNFSPPSTSFKSESISCSNNSDLSEKQKDNYERLAGGHTTTTETSLSLNSTPDNVSADIPLSDLSNHEDLHELSEGEQCTWNTYL